MVDDVYRFVGSLVLWALRTRYRAQIRVAIGAAVGAALLGGYLVAKRRPPEG